MLQLIFIHSRGVSNKLWEKTGILNRELIYYCGLSKNLGLSKMSIYSYDIQKINDFSYEGITISTITIRNKIISKFPKKLREILIAFSHSIHLLKNIAFSDDLFVIRSGQSDGSYVAWLAKIFFNKKSIFVLREGYNQNELLSKKINFQIIYFLISIFVSSLSRMMANIILVPSESDKKKLSKYLHHKVFIHRTYIYQISDHNLQQNINNKLNQKKSFLGENKYLYVGRITEKKGIFELQKIASILDIEIDIYGILDPKIDISLIPNLNYLGVIDNIKLAKLIKKYQFCFHLSRFEGFPKTIFEMLINRLRVLCFKHSCFYELKINNSYEIMLLNQNIKLDTKLIKEDISNWIKRSEEYKIPDSLGKLTLNNCLKVESKLLSKEIKNLT